MNVKAVSVNVGRALLVSALFMFISMVISIMNGMDSAFSPLAISFIITFVVGVFPFIFVRDVPKISTEDGFLTIILSWVLSFIFGMLPYVLWGGEFNITNAWFESVSGYTTTGSTILRNIEALPRSLLFWRSSTHFIGGLGVVVFLLLVLPESSPFRVRLTNMEMSSLSRDGYRFRSKTTVRVILTVYLSIFALSAASLFLAGMPLFDAVNHAFSITATGGFSIKNASIGFYNSVAIDIIVMVFVTLSALHFGMMFSVVSTRSLKPLKNPIVAYFLSCIVVSSIVVALSLKIDAGYESWGLAFLHGSFSTVNYFTTTGFAISDNSAWPPLACAVLMFAALQCGCGGSTSGGIKADRLLISYKAMARQIRRHTHPTTVSEIQLSGGRTVRDDTAVTVFTFIAIYLLLTFVSFLLLVVAGVEPVEALSGSLCSIGNVGPGLHSIGTAGNYALQPVMAKLIYSFDMILGRLEIYPVLAVIAMMFTKNR